MNSIDAYIKAAPKESRAKLRQIRAAIKKSAPGAKEGIKWSMPAFSYKRILVMFAPFKNHIGFYPTPRGVKAFDKALSKYKTGRGSVQFPLNKPLPIALIKKMTAFRVQESIKKDKKWKS